MKKIDLYKIPDEIMKVMKTIEMSGFDSFIVGGYVRDLLLNKCTYDVDICTSAPFNTLKNLFKGESFEEYSSIHFEKGVYNFDITTFRQEFEYKNNKPTKINYTSKLYDDLLRRDFTINALVIDINGNLIDLLNGLKHLNEKTIKVIGNTYNKLDEDNTRILKAIRLHNNLDFQLDNEIKNYLKENSHKLTSLTKEFIKSELDKIFTNDSINFFELDKKYNFSKYINISYKNVIQVNNMLGIWAQIETILPFKRADKIIITGIKKLISKGCIDSFDIYKYGEEVASIASNILKVNIDELIKNIPIRSIFDIDISYGKIKEITNVQDINKIYRKLEKEILSFKLANNEEDIIKFLKAGELNG